MIKSFDELKRIAFGWLGLLPKHFYEMETEDFFLLSEGFFAKRKQDQMQFANVAFCVDAIGWGLAGKKANYRKFIQDWFGENSTPANQEDLIKRSEQVMKKVLAWQKVQDEKDKKNEKLKKKNARTVKNSN